ncbi:MAG: efflux RND transporter periplasmic adaptor subunit [Campylobacterales bacterium]|nr:efflux RND transporter periplasmic adaptor subunit [Campylobacterales bacterium]
MKSKIFITFTAVIIGSGVFYYWFSNTQESTQVYKTAFVERGDLENVVTATGKLEPREYVDVGAQVTGQLHKLHVDIGDYVSKGELLAEIDVTLFMAKVDQQRAQLRYQEASLQDKEAQNALAQINFDRQKNLYEHNATSLELLQSAEFSLQSSNAQIAMLKAQIEQTQSSLRADEANLEFTRIYAPMDGTVVSLSAKQGQTLNANQQAPIILQIADLNTMRVKAEVSEADVTKLRLGMDLYFKTIGKEKRWYAKLQKVEPTPTVTNNVVLYNALFDANNSSKTLMTSMTTQVFFLLASAQNILLIPTNALIREGAKSRESAEVDVLLEDGKLQRRTIELGVSNRVLIEVKSGLKEGERVVVRNSKKSSKKRDKAQMPRMF